ncbi:MAG: Rrf2 family transcriptional regulator [Desulfobacteraceae bacterium]|nr:Rrf2 family transcriptional regulator [Desulfobacteraceae bacterium]
MKLTTRSEYALLALIYMARQQTDGYISVQKIAEAQEIPAKFLEQILLALRRAAYLRSSKGKRGGFRLARSPQEITLAEIVRLFDGALAPTESVSKHFYGPTPVEKEPRLLGVLREMRDYIATRMESTVLSDVM